MIHCVYTCIAADYGRSNLFEDQGVPVELVSGVSSADNLGGDGEAQGRQLPHFPQQTDQSVTVVHLQLSILVTELH